MAEAVEFPEANHVLKPAEGDEQKVNPLHVHYHNGMYVSCWRLTPEEIEQVIKTGVVWHYSIGQQISPVYLTGKNPFDNPPGD